MTKLRKVTGDIAKVALGVLIGNILCADSVEVTKIIFAVVPACLIGIFAVVVHIGCGGACYEGCLCSNQDKEDQ